VTDTDDNNHITQLAYTAARVAEMFGVPEATILNQNRVGRLRSVLVGKHRRFLPCDIEKYAKSLEAE